MEKEIKILNDFFPVSIVIPTYNSEQTLVRCLESIAKQDYPENKIEIIIVDGGSNDRTIEIAKRFRVDKILNNPLRTAEAGKAVGVKSANNEIVAFIDSDNILPFPNWLKEMITPFKDKTISGSEPLYYSYRSSDPYITKYCALMGMNDIVCFFLGNYDRYNYVTDKWTELNVKTLDVGNYLEVEINEKNIPTMGANGFFIRLELIKKVDFDPYFFDIDVIYQLVNSGFNKYAKVKIGIVHLYSESVKIYLKKTRRRIGDFIYYEKFDIRKYPWKQLNKKGILKFILHTLLVVPLMITASKGYRKVPDKAWYYHFIACWLTLITYGTITIISKIQSNKK